MSYVAFTLSGEMSIDASECEREEGFLVFYRSEIVTLIEESTVSRGLFRGAQVKRVERKHKRREWVMHIREDFVNILIPAPEAQAIEAQRAATPQSDAVADESAVPEGNAP